MNETNETHDVNELLVFLHNDLDAAGCQLNIEHKLPQIRKKYWYTNYSNIPEIVDEIERYVNQFGNKHLIIADVSFSDNKDSLRRLYNLPVNITYIDHHLYPDDFWDEFPNMKIHYDKSKCATLLCYEYFKNTNENLEKLSKLIDVYDIWQHKHKHFSISQDMNYYFWQHDISTFCTKLISNNYNIPSDWKQIIDSYHTERDESIRKYNDNKLIHRAGEITIVFGDDFYNEIVIDEHNKGKNFVIIANSYGIVRVRINQDSEYTKEQLDNLRLATTGTKDIGHLHAFTYKMNRQPNFENIMAEIQKITNDIELSCQ